VDAQRVGVQALGRDVDGLDVELEVPAETDLLDEVVHPEVGVAGDAEVGGVQLQGHPGRRDGRVLGTHRLGGGEEIGLVTVVVPPGHVGGDAAGRRGRDEPAFGTDRAHGRPQDGEIGADGVLAVVTELALARRHGGVWCGLAGEVERKQLRDGDEVADRPRVGLPGDPVHPGGEVVASHCLISHRLRSVIGPRGEPTKRVTKASAPRDPRLRPSVRPVLSRLLP